MCEAVCEAARMKRAACLPGAAHAQEMEPVLAPGAACGGGGEGATRILPAQPHPGPPSARQGNFARGHPVGGPEGQDLFVVGRDAPCPPHPTTTPERLRTVRNQSGGVGHGHMFSGLWFCNLLSSWPGTGLVGQSTGGARSPSPNGVTPLPGNAQGCLRALVHKKVSDQ